MDGNVVFSGNLRFLGIPDLLQLIATTNSTGILGLTNPHAQGPASVAFLRGNPTHATYSSLRGLEALYALFGWTTGQFEFRQEKIDSEKTIHRGQMEIVLDGLRMLDEGTIKRLGPGLEERNQPGRAEGLSQLPLIKKPITHYAFLVEEEEFSKGTTIIEEGEFGNWIWMVLHGTAEMSKKTIAGPTKILSVGQGAFIGNISSMMAMGRRRIATFTATETIRLGVLDLDPLYAEYSSLSDEFRCVLLSLDNRFRELTERLSEIHSGIHINEKFFFSSEEKLGAGKRVETPFLISRGNATIVENMKNHPFAFINLAPDDFFGPLSFLEMGHEPFSASVYFSEDLKATPLDPEALQSEYDQLSDTLKNMIEFSLNCISIATMVARRRCLERMKGKGP
ncbi:MAG: DUF4388 domain-containing protein [Deltaproteobacteria bacterium]|nr:DUF4388 domain-containing protein [Deltaproteobacteria bacterium]